VTTEPRKRRSRALEVLQAQNATPPETDLTDEEYNLISGLILRLDDIPGEQPQP